MNRKKFIARLFDLAGGIIVFPSILSCVQDSELDKDSENKSNSPVLTSGTVRFGVITDVHQDLIPDAEDRLGKFITEANKSNLDFIIQLGDFCFPVIKNSNFLEIWNSFIGDKFHVLGNHDLDVNSKETFLNFVSQSDRGAYFSFDKGGFHFVILDNNYIKSGEEFLPYSHQNYYDYSNSEINQVSPEQLVWLEKDLAQTDKPTIVFSHVPINKLVSNRNDVLGIFRKENEKGKKVIAAFSGHQHLNWHLELDGVNHVQINSASYKYSGRDHEKVFGRYPESVEKEYPILPSADPYDDSLFAIVEINGNVRQINIQGREANFVPPSPYDLGYYEYTDQMSPSSKIDSRKIKF
ncbi:metallophosphoesterase family protein [Echinicola salinicaeni]|uniref:metallophosphoesterase family protein n=1 Tax=Echinicola salinicaeni TaxID=2762757 RepID=UPI0016459E26|nr:metallophosphoesterase [Echinicola salinicaeni]